jgi:hypothetical protein
MLDSAAYRASETNARRVMANSRFSSINFSYTFDTDEYPLRAESFLNPLYRRYAGTAAQWPALDRSVHFMSNMYFSNEETPPHAPMIAADKLMHTILDTLTASGHAPRGEDGSPTTSPLGEVIQKIVSSAHLRDVNRLRRVAELMAVETKKPEVLAATISAVDGDAFRKMQSVRLLQEVSRLEDELAKIRSSRSWRVSAPLRYMSSWVRRRLPFVVGLVRWIRRSAGK